MHSSRLVLQVGGRWELGYRSISVTSYVSKQASKQLELGGGAEG